LGVNGCGKTHLAAAIANHLHDGGKSMLFVVVIFDLLDHLRSIFWVLESRVSYDELFEKIKKTQVLYFFERFLASKISYTMGHKRSCIS